MLESISKVFSVGVEEDPEDAVSEERLSQYRIEQEHEVERRQEEEKKEREQKTLDLSIQGILDPYFKTSLAEGTETGASDNVIVQLFLNASSTIYNSLLTSIAKAIEQRGSFPHAVTNAKLFIASFLRFSLNKEELSRLKIDPLKKNVDKAKIRVSEDNLEYTFATFLLRFLTSREGMKSEYGQATVPIFLDDISYSYNKRDGDRFIKIGDASFFTAIRDFDFPHIVQHGYYMIPIGDRESAKKNAFLAELSEDDVDKIFVHNYNDKMGNVAKPLILVDFLDVTNNRDYNIKPDLTKEDPADWHRFEDKYGNDEDMLEKGNHIYALYFETIEKLDNVYNFFQEALYKKLITLWDRANNTREALKTNSYSLTSIPGVNVDLQTLDTLEEAPIESTMDADTPETFNYYMKDVMNTLRELLHNYLTKYLVNNYDLKTVTLDRSNEEGKTVKIVLNIFSKHISITMDGEVVNSPLTLESYSDFINMLKTFPIKTTPDVMFTDLVQALKAFKLNWIVLFFGGSKDPSLLNGIEVLGVDVSQGKKWSRNVEEWIYSPFIKYLVANLEEEDPEFLADLDSNVDEYLRREKKESLLEAPLSRKFMEIMGALTDESGADSEAVEMVSSLEFEVAFLTKNVPYFENLFRAQYPNLIQAKKLLTFSQNEIRRGILKIFR